MKSEADTSINLRLTLAFQRHKFILKKIQFNRLFEIKLFYVIQNCLEAAADHNKHFWSLK